MKKIKYLIVLTVICSMIFGISSFAGEAQDYGTLPGIVSMGSGTMGSTNNICAVAVASVITNNADTNVKVVATSGSTEWVPMMQTEEIDVGVIANYDGLMAFSGKGSFEALNNGEGYEFGIIACGSAQYVVSLTSANSGIETGDDFAGKRYANEYPGNDSVTAIAKALLANHGFTEEDISPVAIESIPNAIDALIEGRLDICQSALKVSKLYDLDAAKGVKFIGVDPSEEAMARTNEYYPSYAVEVTPEDSPWITEPIYALAYDNYVVAHTNLDNEAVYQITKALYENNAELLEASEATTEWFTDNYVSVNTAIPYHEGAIRYYQEIGIWTEEAQAHQEQLLASLR